MAKKIRVFQGLLNYGTQAGILAIGLRKQNIYAISVAYEDKYNRIIDFEFKNDLVGFKKIINKFDKICRKIYIFLRFNTFHFYFGVTLFPNQIDLPFYKFFGKKVIMHYLGNDVQEYNTSVTKYKWTNMQAYIGNDDPDLYDFKIKKRLIFEEKYLDFQIVCAPIYSEFVPKSIVIPLAIDLNKYKFEKIQLNNKLVFMHAPSNKAVKGTQYIINAVNKLILEGEKIELIIIENVTHNKLQEMYKKCDIFIDQIMSGWYGTASIEAMAYGRPVISSIRKEYLKYIDYANDIPIIHADPDSIYDSIKSLIINKSELPNIGKNSRNFVEKVHDVNLITNKLISIYNKL